MINYFKRKFEKRILKSTFKEYGYKINTFHLNGIGKIEYAQWLHPFEDLKQITNSNISYYKNLVKSGQMIIDIGAHTGDTTVPMALAVGKDGLVIGLEPNPYVYKILEINSQINPNHTNIHPLCFAATKQDGEFIFNYSDASFCNGGFLTQIRNQKHNHRYQLTVTGKDLQKYLFEHYQNQLHRLGLIKIDAEGYDKEILKTIPDILNKYKPKLMIECYKKLTSEERNELFDIVSNHGYELYFLENFEENGRKIKIERKNMTYKKHFEILAIHNSMLQ